MSDNNVSALGVAVTIIAVPTFPQGFTIKRFPDDADPINFDDIEVTQAAMGVNGDMITWNKAVPIPCEINVIPNSEEDKNLEILLNSNRAAKNKVAIQNDITMVVAYQDGTTKTGTGGVIIGGTPANGATADSRLKTKKYTFTFANII